MEQTSKKQKKPGNRAPLWLVFVLCGVILLNLLVICCLVVLRYYTVRCEPSWGPIAQTTAAAVQTAAPTPEPQPTDEPIILQPAEIVTKAPVQKSTAVPTEAPTPEPTPEPTAEPTPTPEPTAVPDSFLFGGKTVKSGTTKISGKSLGINGKKNNLTHITAEEVENLVALCPDLEELVLDYCYMDDYAPLGNLTKLRKLHLSSCGVGGGNSIEDISWVAGLTEMRSLDFAHNNISDTTALTGLTNLTFLNIGDNPLEDEDLEPIGNLTKLETLYLYDLKKITDVTPLANLSKLTFLHLGVNSKLKTVKPLTALKKLANLRLNKTKISDLSYFKDFSALKKVDLAKCPIDTGTVPALKECKKLEKIVLDMGDTDLYYAVLDLIGEGYPFHFLYDWSE